VVATVSDKQVFVTILGGLAFALLGGLLIIPIQLLVQLGGGHIDAGDDGWGLLWILLMIVCGIVGLILSAKWARKRYRDFQA
jgi:hypothetical protein